MKCNICGSERAIGSGGSSVPTEIICPDCGCVQTLSKETPLVSEFPKTIKNSFTLKELYVWYNAVCMSIGYMENPAYCEIEKELQYNKDYKKERLKRVKASQEYQDLVALKEKLENIKIDISFETVENK